MVRPLSIEEIGTKSRSAVATQASQRVSDRYKFIETTAIVDAMREADFHPIRAVGVRSRSEDRLNYGKHQVVFRHGTGFGAEVNDMFPELYLTNSHDGIGAFILTVGVFRLVCLNGMVVGDSIEQMRVSHKTKDPLEKIVANAQEMANRFALVGEKIEAARLITMSEADQLMFATQAIGLRFPGDQGGPRLEPNLILEARRVEDNGDDVWTVFNTVQEHLIRGGNPMTMANGRTRRMREMTRMDTSFKFNRELWNLFDQYVDTHGEAPGAVIEGQAVAA